MSNAERVVFLSFLVHTVYLFYAIANCCCFFLTERVICKRNVFFCQQSRYSAVTPFRLQVLNTATVIPAQHHLLVQTAQVQPVIVTANTTKYRHIPSSLRERSDSARPSRLWKCGSWNEHTGGSHIC